MKRTAFFSLCLALVATASPLLAADGDGSPAAPVSATAAEQAPAQPTSPLSIHIGDADFTIGGFMDLTSITRSTNTGNGIGTSFGTLPFSNVPQGQIEETRFSAQNSRLTLQATSKVGAAALKGYLEADFLGNAPTGLNVTSNSNTLRMRIYWVQFRAGAFEFLAGQSWSMMTPGRVGISPVPGDLFYSQDVDTNYQMGLSWGRTPGFRFVFHGQDDVVTAGLGIENPQQYVGSAVTLPSAFPTAEVDQGGNPAAPNPFPDFIGKIALDPRTGKTRQHIEAGVVVRGYKTFNQSTSTSNTATGAGFEVNAVVEPVHNIKIVGTSFISNGGGRYIANTNLPDFIVNSDFSMSTVKSRSFIVGPEITVGKALLYGYYSWAEADQLLTTDTSGKVIGFGVPGSSSANHKLNEPTVGIIQTFFRDPKFGGMQLMIQFSRVERTPFSVAAGTPTKADSNMLYVNVRYVLP